MDEYRSSLTSSILPWLYFVVIVSVVIAIIEAFVIYKARRKVEMEVKGFSFTCVLRGDLCGK